MIQLAQENESFGTRIMTKYSSSVSEMQMIRLKKEIDNIVYRYCDRGGFIDWRNAGDFMMQWRIFYTIICRK